MFVSKAEEPNLIRTLHLGRMAVQEYVCPQLVCWPLKQAHRHRCRGFRGSRKLSRGSVRVLAEQGELGWQVYTQNEKSGLQLGTAVGTGSYGIVREASYKGYKVLYLPFASLARALCSLSPYHCFTVCSIFGW